MTLPKLIFRGILVAAALALAACSSGYSRTTPPRSPASGVTATSGAAGGTTVAPASGGYTPVATTVCTIPQNNGGDHDADNNGGPSDGDGCDK